ncbi:unnamed protein product [Calypogeia fissa]
MRAKMLLQCFFVVLSFVSLASSTHAAADKEGFLRTVVDNAEEEGISWDYGDGPCGPAHWGELSPSWKMCSAGKSQSPIDIDTGKLKYDKQLDVPAVHDYKDTEASVVNTGHSIQVKWPAGTLSVEGKTYKMTHFEFHTPSEHTIDGKSLPLEMQIVHENEDGDYAIVVVLSDYGPTNWWVEGFWHLIPTLDDIGKPIPVGVISPDGFRVNFSEYYRYEGSLTAPDCQENVVWTILSTVYEISEEQVAHLQSLLPSANNRPVQPLGDRKVYIPQSQTGLEDIL